jgi:hypothetical protein
MTTVVDVKRPSQLARIGLLGALLAVAAPAWAIELEWSGYASAVAGRAFSGDPRPWAGGLECPCEAGSFTHGTIYENKWSVRQETRGGLQGRAHLGSTLTATGQVITHGGEEGKPLLDILSLRWTPATAFTLTAGRQRLPMFAYSNYIEVGHAYPWVRLPQPVYGWGIENYDGVELKARRTVGEVDLQAGLFGGDFNDKDNRWLNVYEDRTAPHVERRLNWSKIRGLWGTAQWGDLEIRAARQRFKSREYSNQPGGEIEEGNFDVKASDLAVNYVSGTWVVRAELLSFRVRPIDPSLDPYMFRGHFVGVGYQLGRWLPMLTDGYIQQGDDGKFRTTSLSLRYDLNRNVAIKTQLERSKVNFDPGSGMKSKLLLFAVDTSF